MPNGIDESILYFFNRVIASDTLDAVMIVVTNSRHWIPLYAFAALVFIWKYKWRGVRIVAATAVMIGFANALTNMMLKELFARPRPCAEISAGIHQLDWIRLPDGMRYDFSMPSSHAVNNFAGAIFFSLLFPRRITILSLFIAAFIVSMTRVYLGLHYPSDTLAGACIGMLVGYLFAKGYRSLEKRFFSDKESV